MKSGLVLIKKRGVCDMGGFVCNDACPNGIDWILAPISTNNKLFFRTFNGMGYLGLEPRTSQMEWIILLMAVLDLFS